MGPLPVRCEPQPPTMIVLHPNSVCDVCLEGYGGTNVPHAITCGHIFCLRCLRSLTRQNCPLCRSPFQPEDVRKLHIDECSRPSTPVDRSIPGTPESDYNEFPTPARDFQNRITRIVLDGAKATEVRDFIDEVRRWLTTQPSDEHPDLRSAYLLLFKYTDLQYKVKEEKAAAADFRELAEQLKETLQSEREAADLKYQKLAQKRVEEMERAMTEERVLRDRLDHVEKEWKIKYDSRVAECNRLGEEMKSLNEELRRLKGNRNPLPTPPRAMEARHYFTSDRISGEPMAIVDDDEVKDDEPAESDVIDEDRFQLSPIPSTATLPVSNLPNRQNFRALTAEDSDIEELKSRRANAFMRRSIDPIQIRPTMPRMNSNSSIRHDMDVNMARSIPRTSPDVHMASCSSSPNTSFQYVRDKERVDDPAINSGYGARPSPRRPSVSSTSYPRDQDEQERLNQSRAQHQLRELLELNTLTTVDASILDSYRPRHHSPESSVPVTRNPSPVTNSNMGPPVPQSIQNPLLQRPALSRASTAAMQAERERARSISSKESPLASSQAATARDRDRDRDRERESVTPSHQQISPQASLYHHRRPSTSGMRGRSSTSPIGPPAPSGLTRSMWAMQDPQRA